jgi:AraC-like DNA-binding protein
MVIQPYFAIFNMILIAVVTIALLGLRTPGKTWLCAVLLFYGAHTLMRWGFLVESRFFVVYFPTLAFPASYLIGTALLLYTDRVLFKGRKQRLHWYALVPTLSLFVHAALLMLSPDEMVVARVAAQLGIHRVYAPTMALSMAVYNIVFVSIAFWRIVTYRRRSKDNFSTDMSRSTRWLLVLVLLHLGVFLSKLAMVLLSVIGNTGFPIAAGEELAILAFLLVFIYYLITKPDVLPMEPEADTAAGSKYAKAILPERTRKRYMSQLEEYMIQEQAFLDRSLSVPQVSQSLGIPQHHVSMTINTESNQNFYSFVNSFRIRHAVDRLKDPKEREESILEIAYSSGFQSKTSFNKAFKSLTGMTPTEYRKSQPA